MGPIIEAIEQGHYVNTQSGFCRGPGCPPDVPFVSCPVLREARREQTAYADRLKASTQRADYQRTMIERTPK